MKDAPAFDFYPERWLVGVAALSDAEQLAYLRLLCHQWLLNGLPSELPALRRLAGKGVTEALLQKFPVSADGKRRNHMLENVRSEQRHRIAKKSEQRRAAAMRRWHNEPCGRDATAYPPHMQKPCGRDAGAMPTTHHPPLYSVPKDQSEPVPVPSREAGEPPDGGGSGSFSIPPVSMEAAKQAGPAMGVSVEAAEAWWLDHDARGWVDSRGQPVRRWRSSLTAYGRRWQSNDFRRTGGTDAAPPARKATDLF